MLKILCVFTASMFAMAVSGQSFVQKSMSNKVAGNYIQSTDNNRGLELAAPALTEEATVQLDSIVQEGFDKTTETWLRTGKYKMGYENSDTASYFNTYLWNDTTQSWTIYPQDIKRFDTNGNLIHRIVTPGSVNSKTFIYNGKKEYFNTYSNEGRTENIITYQQDYFTKEFVFQKKDEIVWDNNGKQTFTQTSLWNKELSIWQARNKTEMEYDQNGYQTMNATYLWLDFLNRWHGSSKDVFEFDAEGNRLRHFISSWNDETATWTPLEKLEFSNYINKIPTVLINFYWDHETEKWKPTTKELKE